MLACVENNGAASLVVDAGTIDATILGAKEITVSQGVSYGDILMPVAALQGSATTRATVKAKSGGDPTVGDVTSATVSSTILGGYSVEGVTCAAPVAPTLGVAGSGSVPGVLVKVA